MIHPGRRTREELLKADLAKLDELAARPWPSERPECFSCGAFTPNAINPTAAVGRCDVYKDTRFAGQRPPCTRYRSRN